MITKVITSTDKNAIKYAKDVLREHGVVAFPTDTVYGLGAGAFDVIGVDRLYSVKGREHTKAIAVLIGDVSQLSQVALNLREDVKTIAQAFWPGPLTLIVRRNPEVPEIVSRSETIGVRIPNHDFARSILKSVGPLAVTSANLSGAPSTSTVDALLQQLDGRIDLVLDGGRTPGGVPSTVLNCTTDEFTILREGPISSGQILSVLK